MSINLDVWFCLFGCRADLPWGNSTVVRHPTAWQCHRCQYTRIPLQERSLPLRRYVWMMMKSQFMIKFGFCSVTDIDEFAGVWSCPDLAWNQLEIKWVPLIVLKRKCWFLFLGDSFWEYALNGHGTYLFVESTTGYTSIFIPTYASQGNNFSFFFFLLLFVKVGLCCASCRSNVIRVHSRSYCRRRRWCAAGCSFCDGILHVDSTKGTDRLPAISVERRPQRVHFFLRYLVPSDISVLRRILINPDFTEGSEEEVHCSIDRTWGKKNNRMGTDSNQGEGEHPRSTQNRKQLTVASFQRTHDLLSALFCVTRCSLMI